MIVCPSCGEENPERARFCLACGSPPEVVVPAGEERKVVSVLFVDLVGFTRRSDRADPEDVRATLRPYYERVKADLERFDGTVEKFIGDAGSSRSSPAFRWPESMFIAGISARRACRRRCSWRRPVRAATLGSSFRVCRWRRSSHRLRGT